jgi:DNA-binding NarL/FixJ family response regulator
MEKIRILLVDDHEIVRMGMRALLEQQPHFQIVAEAGTAEDAIRLTEQYQPDVVVMDVRMPGMSGIEATKLITLQYPKTHVVILTSFAEDELVLAAIRAGAAGYVLKRIGSNELVHTIEAVARGESALEPTMLAAIFHEVKEAGRAKDASVFAELSLQEMRILKLVSDGLTNREIAGQLFLGEGTVRNYVSSILNKLQLSNRAEAAAFAVQHNLKDHMQE